jgi:transaldolase
VNTVPEATLLAFADHGEVGAPIPDDGGDAEEVIARHARSGVDVEALAAQLQADGARSFVKSWNDLLDGLARTAAAAGQAP